MFALVLSLTCHELRGQTLDTSILGTATDSSGAVLPGATVTVLSPATGIKKTAVTGTSGEYAVTYLTPGTYDVTVEAKGFTSQRRTGIVLQLNQQDKIDFTLGVGGSQQTVQVEATQPLLQSENAALGAVIGAERTANLPLNGRKFDDLAVLTPGVSVYNPDLHSSSTDGSTISSNGGRSTWGQINVDGITMVNNRHAYVNLFPSIDAIEEFTVQTGDYSAQYGGSAGANVNIQLKSGTNHFHGTLFEFIRNDAVDARNYFRPAPLPKNILKQNQFGATLGGPIIKDRTFFFLSYEGLRSIQEFPSTANVLTPAERTGDFSATSTPIINPLSPTREAYPNNQIPVNPISANIINTYMPLPNSSGSTNYAGVKSGRLSVDQGIVRVDHKFNDKNQLFVHYIYAMRNFPITDVNPNFHFTGTYPIHNAALQYIHIFSPSLLNELRLGADIEHVKQLSTRTGTDFTVESLGINGFKVGGPNGRPLTPNEEGFPILNISGFLGMGDDLAASNLDYSRTYQLADNVTWTKGKHTIVIGTDLRYILDNATTNNTPFGEQDFTGDVSGNAAADFILGYPRTSITPEGVPITAARQWRTAEYIQDNWRPTSKLTINLGLRYDLFAPPLDVNAVTRTLDFSGPVPVFTPAPGQELHNLWSITHKNFGPRLGFAYSATPTTVVRGGYGIFYYGGQFDYINILQLNPPTAGSLTITNTNVPTATIQNPVPAALYPDPPFFNATTLPADRKRSDLYLQTFNLTVSKQFKANVLDVSYVGVIGNHLDSSIQNFNSPAPDPNNLTADVQPRRPYPTFARIRYQDFDGASNYNGLQVHFEHRMAHQLSFTAAYTYSHELDNQGFDTNAGGCDCQDPRNPHEWASGGTDQRHDLSIGYVWQLPTFAKTNTAAKMLVNGWALNGLIQLASGNPYNVRQSIDGQNTDNQFERPNRVPGSSLSVPNRTIDHWFNTDAFTLSTVSFGTSRRNTLVSPATDVVNIAAAKNFQMPYNDSHQLQLRFEAFNAFNTPQWSTPDASLGDGTFGQITSTKADNRELQLAVKYLF
jgi:hypothetical protein